jgi:hypothetical protein
VLLLTQHATFYPKQISPSFSWKGDGIQTLSSRYTDGIRKESIADFSVMKF